MTLTAAIVRRLIPRRPVGSNKGKNGHLLIAAGSKDMTGAAYLCALGALKAGAGLVTVAAPEPVRKLIRTRLPEAMTVSIEALPSFFRKRTITHLAVGPGLTVHPSIRRLVMRLLRINVPTVLDADGLNNVKPHDVKGRPVVITPHPGEMGRFLGISTKEVQADRAAIARQTAMHLNIVCVLKGHHTVISNGQKTFINPTGNPAMAAGGMGDVLTGVIAALLAQGLSLFDAACAGVYVHGLAGDLARISDRGLLASELAQSIPKALRKLGIR